MSARAAATGVVSLRSLIRLVRARRHGSPDKMMWYWRSLVSLLDHTRTGCFASLVCVCRAEIHDRDRALLTEFDAEVLRTAAGDDVGPGLRNAWCCGDPVAPFTWTGEEMLRRLTGLRRCEGT